MNMHACMHLPCIHTYIHTFTAAAQMWKYALHTYIHTYLHTNIYRSCSNVEIKTLKTNDAHTYIHT